MAGTIAAVADRRSKRMTPRPRKRLSKRELRTPAGRFAAHLDALLKERGWTSYDLAERLPVGEPAVRRWLRAEGTPEYEVLEIIGRALDVPEHPFPDYRMVLPPPV